MSILSELKTRAFRSDILKEPDFFEKPLRRTRTYRYSTIETVFVAALGILIVVTYWSLLSGIVLFFVVASIVCIVATWIAIIRDHSQLSQALKQNPTESVGREALTVAA